jgi:hypothetical protein
VAGEDQGLHRKQQRLDPQYRAVPGCTALFARMLHLLPFRTFHDAAEHDLYGAGGLPLIPFENEE